jgi:hypothetical protein
MTLDSLWQKTLPAALTAPSQGGPSTFGSHPSTKTVLTFASSF